MHAESDQEPEIYEGSLCSESFFQSSHSWSLGWKNEPSDGSYWTVRPDVFVRTKLMSMQSKWIAWCWLAVCDFLRQRHGSTRREGNRLRSFVTDCVRISAPQTYFCCSYWPRAVRPETAVNLLTSWRFRDVDSTHVI